MLRYVMVLWMICAAAVHAAPLKVVQRLHVGAFEYVLYENGNIYADNGMFRKIVDDGSGTVQLVGERNNIYILKKGSEVWQYNGKIWTLVDDYEGTTRLEWQGGACVAFKANGDAYKCALAKNEAGETIANWTKLPKQAAPAVAGAPVATVAANLPSQPESAAFTK